MKDEINKKILQGFKISNKMMLLIFLLSPILAFLVIIIVPFATIIYIFKSYWEFKTELTVKKQKHQRAIKNLN